MTSLSLDLLRRSAAILTMHSKLFFQYVSRIFCMKLSDCGQNRKCCWCEFSGQPFENAGWVATYSPRLLEGIRILNCCLQSKGCVWVRFFPSVSMCSCLYTTLKFPCMCVLMWAEGGCHIRNVLFNQGKKYKMTREQGKHINVPHLHTLVSQDTFIKNTNWILQFISHYSIVYLPLLYVKDKGRNQIEEKGKLLSPQMSNSSSA